MKRNSKKIISLFLVVVLLFSMSYSAFAAAAETISSVSVTLSSDKKQYKSGEEIKIKTKIKNETDKKQYVSVVYSATPLIKSTGMEKNSIKQAEVAAGESAEYDFSATAKRHVFSSEHLQSLYDAVCGSFWSVIYVIRAMFSKNYEIVSVKVDGVSAVVSAKLTASETLPGEEPSEPVEPSEPTEPENYTVSFETNGGGEIATQTVSSGLTATYPDVEPSIEGYRFVAWYIDEELTTVYDFTLPVTSNITLYAKYEELVQPGGDEFIDQPEPDVEIYSFETDVWDILVGTTETVTFTAEVFSEIELGETDVSVVDSNNIIIGYMNDNGINGDETANDGIYTLKVDLIADKVSTKTYYAQYKSISSSSITISNYKKLNDDELEELSKLINDIATISSKYADINGNISENNENLLISEMTSFLEEKKNVGIVNEYYFKNSTFSIVLRSGAKYSYTIPIEGIDAATMITNQPYKGTYDTAEINDLSDQATDGSARLISSISNRYTFSSVTSDNSINSSNDDNYDLEEVSLESLKNLSNASIVSWHGHGNYDELYGSFMGTGTLFSKELYNKYIDDINAGRILANNTRFMITGGFIQKYVGKMDGSFVYLGTCSSAKDMVDGIQAGGNRQLYELAQSFINKGATAVVGNTSTIHTKYNTSMQRDIFSAMSRKNDNDKYNTLSESLKIAKELNGKFDTPIDGISAEVRFFPQSESAENYRLFPNDGAISGSVKNAQNGSAINNALIRVYDVNGTYLVRTRTDASGKYSLALAAGNYVIRVSAGSYKSVKLNVIVRDGHTTYNETFLMINAGLTNGFANGVISNSITGVSVPNVTINVRKNWNNINGSIVCSTTTNENGYYEISCTAGAYTIEYYKGGYVTGYKNIIVAPFNFSAQNAQISPVTSDDVYRVVLSWGEYPSDLDSHLTAKTKSGYNEHVYYSNKEGDSSNLDIDDTTSYGPETVTVTDFANFVNGFTYSVHDYTNRYSDNCSQMSQLSEATVKLYKGSELIKTYFVPTNRLGTVWRVFSIDATGNITDLNEFYNQSDPELVN